MRYLTLALFILLLTIAASPQTTTVERVTTPVPAKTTLRARVYYEDTGRPVRRMSVTLLSQAGPAGGEFSGLTDALGNLEIKTCVPGSTTRSSMHPALSHRWHSLISVV